MRRSCLPFLPPRRFCPIRDFWFVNNPARQETATGSRNKLTIALARESSDGLLTQQFARQGGGRFAQPIDLFLRLILALVVLLNRQMILCRQVAEIAQPLGVDVQSPRRLMHRSGVNLLALPAQKPIDENLPRVWMRRVLQHH